MDNLYNEVLDKAPGESAFYLAGVFILQGDTNLGEGMVVKIYKNIAKFDLFQYNKYK